MLEGLIIKGISSFYYVQVGDDLYECKARGIFKSKNLTPLVGDKVRISIVDKEKLKGVIDEILPRKSSLVRPPIANIDKAIIIFSLVEPSPNLLLLDKFIIASEKEGLDVLIVLSKSDLDKDGSIASEIISEFEKIGYRVILIDSISGENIDEVRKELENCISVLAGQSGVGKSSLLNAINPSFSLKTAEISQKLGRGKHTTRHAELFNIGKNAIVADTPGFSSFEFEDMEVEELKEYFIEFEKYSDCRYSNKCLHRNEPGCGVKQAVEEGSISKRRYESYLHLLEVINEIKNRKKKSFRRKL